MVISTITAHIVVVETTLTSLSAMTSLSAIWVHAIVTIGSIGRPINITMLLIGKRFLVGVCFSSTIRGWFYPREFT